MHSDLQGSLRWWCLWMFYIANIFRCSFLCISPWCHPSSLCLFLPQCNNQTRQITCRKFLNTIILYCFFWEAGTSNFFLKGDFIFISLQLPTPHTTLFQILPAPPAPLSLHKPIPLCLFHHNITEQRFTDALRVVLGDFPLCRSDSTPSTSPSIHLRCSLSPQFHTNERAV